MYLVFSLSVPFPVKSISIHSFLQFRNQGVIFSNSLSLTILCPIHHEAWSILLPPFYLNFSILFTSAASQSKLLALTASLRVSLYLPLSAPICSPVRISFSKCKSDRASLFPSTLIGFSFLNNKFPNLQYNLQCTSWSVNISHLIPHSLSDPFFQYLKNSASSYYRLLSFRTKLFPSLFTQLTPIHPHILPQLSFLKKAFLVFLTKANLPMIYSVLASCNCPPSLITVEFFIYLCNHW